MPVVFVGHGSPMNAIEDNRWTRGFQELVASIPRPNAILAISAHWYTRGTFVTENETPKTIHDMSGFPPALYELSINGSTMRKVFIDGDANRSVMRGRQEPIRQRAPN
jgi:4,5-DOPA dioxygenase extradiol